MPTRTRLACCGLAVLAATACTPDTGTRSTDFAADSTTTAPAPAPAAASSYLLQKGQAGQVNLNMPLRLAQQRFGARLTKRETTAPADGGTEYQLADSSGRPLLHVLAQCNPNCTVTRIEVLSTRYQTAEGLGLGAQLGEIKTAYTLQEVQWAPELGLTVRVPELSARLVLDVSNRNLDEAALERLTVATLPDDLTVERILLD